MIGCIDKMMHHKNYYCQELQWDNLSHLLEIDETYGFDWDNMSHCVESFNNVNASLYAVSFHDC